MEYSGILVGNCAFRLDYRSSTVLTHAGTFFFSTWFFCVVRFPVFFANMVEVITHVYKSQIKVRRRFLLTGIKSIEYDPVKDPLVFKLLFSASVMTLEASSSEEAADWVNKIRCGRQSCCWWLRVRQ